MNKILEAIKKSLKLKVDSEEYYTNCFILTHNGKSVSLSINELTDQLIITEIYISDDFKNESKATKFDIKDADMISKVEAHLQKCFQ